MSDATVTIPKIGKVKKQYLYIGGAGIAAFVAYKWWVAGSAPADDELPPPESTGTIGANIGSGSGGYYDPNDGGIGSDTTIGTPISSNSQWSQTALSYLENMGYDTGTVGVALGKYLRGDPLTAAEQNIIKTVLAVVGNPPTGGPYAIVTDTSQTVTKLTAPTGLKVTATTANSVTLSWNKVPGASYYRAYRSGASTNVGSTDAANLSMTISGLQPNTTYSFQVAADTTTASPGPKSSAVSAKTKAVSLAKPTGLKSAHITKSSFRVTCSAVKGAQYYRWYVNGKASGASDQPFRDFTGLKSNTSYKVTVKADTSSQSPGPESAALTVKTKK